MTGDEAEEGHNRHRRHQLRRKQAEMRVKKEGDFHHNHHLPTHRFHQHHHHLGGEEKPRGRFRVDQSIQKFDQYGFPVRF